MNETVLRANRAVVASRLALGIVLTVAGSYWIYLSTPEFAPFVIIAVVVILSYVFAPMLRLFLTGKAIILTDQGLLDRTGGVAFVTWGEIRGVRILPYAGLKAVELDLHHPDAVLARMPPIRRVLLRHYMRRYGGRPMLTGSFVQGGAEHLVQLIQERIDARPDNKAV